ncbi:MAG: glycoside hydrolase family 97 protein [Dysgonamonadaceae bacterium]|jgi:alpha-glucosidase|nr:glycoside hydrolase family 97 protein [Dysgonamonadaceae bacterium]
MNKKTIFFTVSIAVCSLFASAANNKPIELRSPDGALKITVKLAGKITYDLSVNEQIIFENCGIALETSTAVFGENPKLVSQKRASVNENITPVVPLKFSTVKNQYNSLLLNFKGNYAVEFRAFDEGLAYRIILNQKGEIEVLNEDFSLQIPNSYLLHFQFTGSFKTSYEDFYHHLDIPEWQQNSKMAPLPLLIDTKKQGKILFSESDLSDYPAMFLKTDGNNRVVSTFPKMPLEFGDDGDRSVKITKEAAYIVRTTGTRTFPWRYFVMAKTDAQLAENTMTLKLAAKSEIADASWIKPGQASWEWWNGASPYGPDVNFVSGFNLDTYKYFIDFASKYGVEYIVMDEGWAKSTRDPYTPNPKVDVHEIVRYGKERNVGVFLWLTWLTVENNFELFKIVEQWGVKGLKIDFMDRSDAWMVDFYERVAREAAAHHLLIDFHGAFKPAGLEYKYPNVITYEGVRGMEAMGSCLPDNSVYYPFIRNAVGPMDYTPGAMISMQPDSYGGRSGDRPNSASIGTRAYQMALFVAFESGLQMLADNPTLYYRNHECTEFITSVPTIWDETKVLAAEAGKYYIVAKRKGDKWFIGGICNSDEQERSFELNLSFLPTNKTLMMTSFEDGINAGRQALDYRKKVKPVKQGDKLFIKMVHNGGFAAIIE